MERVWQARGAAIGRMKAAPSVGEVNEFQGIIIRLGENRPELFQLGRGVARCRRATGSSPHPDPDWSSSMGRMRAPG